MVLSNFVFTVIVNTTALLASVGCSRAAPQRVEPATVKTAPVASPSSGFEKTVTTTVVGPGLNRTSRSANLPLPAPVVSASLSLQLSALAEHTGGELGLTVPMLLLTLGNVGRDAIDVPQPGVDLLLSLRVRLKPLFGAGKLEQRYSTLLRTFTVQLSPLPPGPPIRQGLSPLSLKRDDVPLPVGRYRVAVCVPPSTEAPYPSRFTDAYGGACSNEVEIEAKKSQKRSR